jgi:hypothetical protein
MATHPSARTALIQQIAKMTPEEVTAKIAAVKAQPWKLPKGMAETLPKTQQGALNRLRVLNPSLGVRVEKLINTVSPPQKERPTPISPIPWAKYAKYIPKPILDHMKAEHERRVEYAMKALDPKPLADLYNRVRLEEMIINRERVAQLTEEHERLQPVISQIEDLVARLPTLTVNELLTKNPTIDAEIQQEIAEGEWAPHGRIHEEEHHHH